jgi:hypothetical protein
VLDDVGQWWANGNILCNVQLTENRQRRPHFWGDQHLPQMKDMIQKTAERARERGRPLSDCDFFLNKRDYPQLKADLTEPYDFLYDTGGEGGTAPPLAREKHLSYAPILSYYTSPVFADLPFPCAEDWMTAVGDFFPPSPKDNFFRRKSEEFEQNVQKEADRAGKTLWEMKKPTAFFRGSGTGGGSTADDPADFNQRLKLHALSEAWKTDPRYNAQNSVDGVPFMDAAVSGWNWRDKKLKGRKMCYSGGGPTGDFVPMYEQPKFKYHIYAEGHCAANRYTAMMRSGCVIMKVTSTCKASEMWFFPMLVPYQDHVPVKADLSDLAEQIEWCKTHDDECQRIVERTRALYDQLFSAEGIMDYCQLMFAEISQRFHRGQAEPPPAGAARTSSKPSDVAPYQRPVTGPSGLKPTAEGLPGSRLPPADWLGCPEAGTPIRLGQLLVVPCKAPLGESYAGVLQEGSHFSPARLDGYLRQRYGAGVGLVINLSSSERWYDPQRDWAAGTDYVWIDCGKRGGAPPGMPEVNRCAWAVLTYRMRELNAVKQAREAGHPDAQLRCVVMHCTHGFNRTGFMLSVSRAYPSWSRSILTEIYLCHARSCHEIEDGNARTGPQPAHRRHPRRPPGLRLRDSPGCLCPRATAGHLQAGDGGRTSRAVPRKARSAASVSGRCPSVRCRPDWNLPRQRLFLQ